MSDHGTIDPRTPVLVGVGLVQQRSHDPSLGRDALGLMLDAVRAASADAGHEAVLGQIDVVAVPRGQWRYEDPGRHLAAAVGSPGARSILALVGVLQQTLLGLVCERIAGGDVDVALVVGGEARHRRLRQKQLGLSADEAQADGEPDDVLRPAQELVLRAELDHGPGAMPVAYYAIIESALRRARGVSVEAHRDELAALYHRFSEVAAANPHAWRAEEVPAEVVRGSSGGAENRMVAFPYTKLHNSSWNVDQAAALLFCSASKASELGIPPSRWVFPLASGESNHMSAMSERASLDRCAGAAIAGRRVFDLAGVDPSQLDLVELYSCFPAAVQIHARELGIRDDVDWTVTGGMPFAGGPFNSYVLQSTGRMAQLLRDRPASVGLVTSVSGILTKHGLGLWSGRPGQSPFASVDVTAEVAAAETRLEVRDTYEGPAVVVGCTVIHGQGEPLGVVLLDTPDGARALARSDDATTVRPLETEECCGRRVVVAGNRFRFV